ncbi:MAG: hypothetical protein ABEJ89_03030 [Haloarculaceae archaeon]
MDGVTDPNADGAETGGDDGTKESDPAAADRAVADIRERGQAIRDRQVAEAVRKLEAKRDLDDRERKVLEALGDRLVDRLLAVPESALEAADAETARTARDLFG